MQSPGQDPDPGREADAHRDRQLPCLVLLLSSTRTRLAESPDSTVPCHGHAWQSPDSSRPSLSACVSAPLWLGPRHLILFLFYDFLRLHCEAY